MSFGSVYGHLNSNQGGVENIYDLGLLLSVKICIVVLVQICNVLWVISA